MAMERLVNILRQLLARTLSWKGLAILFALINIKNMPFMWEYRFIRLCLARLLTAPPMHTPTSLWLPAISRSYAPLLEADHNLHKSNSTYLSDIDMSRSNLGLLITRSRMALHPWSRYPAFNLGGVMCGWKREISLYTTYEMWSRILSWDKKWFYVLTTFVEGGRFRPGSFVLQGKGKGKGGDGLKETSPDGTTQEGNGMVKEHDTKAIYASAISRIVFKIGRKTVAPESMLKEAGLLPAEEDVEASKKWEEMRVRRLAVAQLEKGWDAVHEAFFDNTEEALGNYTDMLFR